MHLRLKHADRKWNEKKKDRNKQEKLVDQQIILNCLVAVILLAGLLGSMTLYWGYREYVFYNNARLLLSDELNLLSSSWTDGKFQKETFEKGVTGTEAQLVLADLQGKIVYSQKENQPVGEKIILNELLQTDRSLFLQESGQIKLGFIVEGNQGACGFAAFYLPSEQVIGFSNEELLWRIFWPEILAVFLVMIMLLFRQFYLKHRMLEPVKEMVASSKAIIEGNYSIPVIRARNENIIDNDIDLLAYNFELMRDELSEKIHRENELKKSQKELISCISHDLKTPISTIQAYGEGIRDGLAREPERVGKYAEVIVKKALLLSKMINDLIEHSNAELNQLSIQKKEQYVGDFMDKASGELRGLALYSKVEFNYNNQAPNLLISFDENRIMQVLANLVDNAIKYKQEGQPVISMNVVYEEENQQIKVSMIDNGRGISLGDIPFVFSRFYRGEKSRSSSIPGSGLGLSICKYIVEAHGGELTCESHINTGTIFTFSIA